MIIAVDFDGTLCDHRFPDIGMENPGAFEALKRFQEAGAKLILWTMRDDERAGTRKVLSEAVAFCKERGVEFWGVNENPEQRGWTGSPKQYAHVYIDDAAFGCPLRECPRSGSRPWVDWSVVTPEILKRLAATA